jgi:hypothetical protein
MRNKTSVRSDPVSVCTGQFFPVHMEPTDSAIPDRPYYSRLLAASLIIGSELSPPKGSVSRFPINPKEASGVDPVARHIIRSRAFERCLPPYPCGLASCTAFCRARPSGFNHCNPQAFPLSVETTGHHLLSAQALARKTQKVPPISNGARAASVVHIAAPRMPAPANYPPTKGRNFTPKSGYPSRIAQDSP